MNIWSNYLDIDNSQLTESKSMQTMCQVYAAVSYICIDDPESSSLVKFSWTTILIISKNFVFSSDMIYLLNLLLFRLGTRFGRTCLQVYGFLCGSSRENMHSLCLWTSVDEAT